MGPPSGARSAGGPPGPNGSAGSPRGPAPGGRGPAPGGGAPGDIPGIIIGGGGIGGIADFLTKRDLTTGSGGFEYAAGSITSVLAYKILKVLEFACRLEYETLLPDLAALGRVIGISPR